MRRLNKQQEQMYQLYNNNNNSIQSNNMIVETPRQSLVPTIIAKKYSITRVLFNKDYLAKNQKGEHFLIVVTHKKKLKMQIISAIVESNIISSIQKIEQQGTCYEVFPLQKKMQWAGDLPPQKAKSEIYCITLLYNTIRHLIRPLTIVPNGIKYLILDNLWLKNSALYLFLRSKQTQRNLSRTETKHSDRSKEKESPLANQQQGHIIKRMGQILWQIFYQDEAFQIDRQKKFFKELLKSMVKNQVHLQDLQKIMENKLARKRFISAKRNTIDINASMNWAKANINYNTLNVAMGDYQNDRAQHARVSLTPNYQGAQINNRYLLCNNKADRVTKSSNYQKIGLHLHVDSKDDSLPPSFTRTRKGNRRSLFKASNNITISRYSPMKQKNKADSHQKPRSFTINYDNYIAQNNQQNDISSSAIDKLKSLSPPQFKPHKKLDNYFKTVFQDQKNLYHIRIKSISERLQEKSKQKALKKFKDSIDYSQRDNNQVIDDKNFRNCIKQMRKEHTKQIFGQKNIIQRQKVEREKKASIQNRSYFKQLKKISEGLIETRPDPKKQKQLNSQQSIQPITFKNGQMPIKIKNSNVQMLARPYTPKQNMKEKINTQQEQIEGIYLMELNAQSFIKKDQIVVKTFKEYKKNEIKQQSIPKVQNKNAKIQERVSSHDEKKMNYLQLPNIQIPFIDIAQLNKIQQLKQTEPKILEPKLIQSPKFNPNFKANNLNPNTIFNKVETNLLDGFESPQQYVYISKMIEKPSEIIKPKQQKGNLATANQGSNNYHPPMHKKDLHKRIMNSKTNLADYDEDQIQEVIISNKKDQQKKSPPAKQQEKINPLNLRKQNVIKMQQPIKVSEKQKRVEQKIQKAETRQLKNSQRKKSQEQPQIRQKTAQSNASSTNKTVRKQIDQYIFMINKIGQAVAKTSRLVKKLQNIEWYVGIYFLYKRFYFERKKIQKCLEQGLPKLTRYQPFYEAEWNQWLSKGQREQLLIKCRQDNKNIETSINKMAKKIQSKQLPGRVLLHSSISQMSLESSLIAVEYVVDQYDQVIEQNVQADPQIWTHLCEMINALYVVAELDKKIKEKRPIMDFANVKRGAQELKHMVEIIFDCYDE